VPGLQRSGESVIAVRPGDVHRAVPAEAGRGDRADAVLVRAQAAPSLQASVSFPNDIEPILERSCRSCHGDTAPMGRLDLSSRESLLRGGARGTDLVPGNAEESRLYRRVAGLEKPPMPAKGAALTATEVAAPINVAITATERRRTSARAFDCGIFVALVLAVAFRARPC